MHFFEQDHRHFQLLLLESLLSDLRVHELGTGTTSSGWQTNRGAFWFAYNLSTTFSLALQVQISVNYRYGTIYREVFNFKFEWCDFIDGLSKGPVQAAFFSILKKAAPQLFLNCPLEPVSQADQDVSVLNFFSQGMFERKNVSFEDSNWPSPLPSGFYRTDLTFGEVWRMQIDGEITSEIKTSFGWSSELF